MDSKKKMPWQEDRIESYAREFALKVCPEEPALGESLPQLSPVEQVNYFLLFKLEKAWKQEMKRWKKAPFFDWEHTEVQNALKNCMNILSRHIRLEEETLLSLLKEATEKTLRLILKPENFYRHQWKTKADISLTKDIQPILKYIKCHKHIFKLLASEFSSDTMPQAAVYRKIREISELHDESIQKDRLGYLNEMSAVIPIGLSEFFSPREDKGSSPHSKKIPGLLNFIQPELQKSLIRDLFHGQRETLEKVLRHVENCASFDESMSYLVRQQNIKVDSSLAKEFFKIVYKHFLSHDKIAH
ncbi:MAG: hypothetical protein OXB93_00070 [Cytophagales bacterium]|nr:hypothetical protein [Cytophagales bacterium]